MYLQTILSFSVIEMTTDDQPTEELENVTTAATESSPSTQTTEPVKTTLIPRKQV